MICSTGKSGEMGVTNKGESVVKESLGASDVVAHQSRHVTRLQEYH